MKPGDKSDNGEPCREDAFPDVSGEWAMEIYWAHKERDGKIDASAFIHQDGSKIGMTVRSTGSDSHTILVQAGRDHSGGAILYYMYEVEPKASYSDAPGSYKGAAILRYFPHGQELSGNYWTSQKSAGHFKLVRKPDAIGETMNNTIDVLLITAIREEYDAARLAFSATSFEGEGVRDWKDMEASAGTQYQHGIFHRDEKALFSVALAKPPRMGGIQTGQLAAMLADRLRPGCLVMCGVCAGNPKDLALGDLVISEFAYQYDEGKLEKDAFVGDHRQSPISKTWHDAAQAFQPEILPSFGQPSSRDSRYWLLERLYAGDNPKEHPARSRYFPKGRWKEFIEALEAERIIELDGTTFKLTDAGIKEVERSIAVDVDPPEQLPIAIKVGPIASGNVVVKDGVTWDTLRGMGVRSVLALEMEAAAIGLAARGAGVPEWIVIKGVMDHADPKKDDRYKPFAARASAEALRAFLVGRFLGNSRPADLIHSQAGTEALTGTNLVQWRPHTIEGPFFDELRSAMERHAPNFVSTFDLAIDAARTARVQGALAFDISDQLRAELGSEIAKTHRNKLKQNPTILRIPTGTERRALIAKIWSSHDEYVGEAAGEVAEGLGVLRVYELSEELTPSLRSSYAGLHEGDKYGPIGVFTFPDQSHFAGRWTSGHPSFGYREFIGRRTELNCDFYLGALQGFANRLHPLWVPHGEGIAVDAIERRIRCGKLLNGVFDEIRTEFSF